MNAPIKYVSLTADQQEQLRDIHIAITKLIEFNNKVNRSLLTYLFGKVQADRHANNFDKCRGNGDVLLYYKQLTSDELSDLMANLYYNETLYAHCH